MYYLNWYDAIVFCNRLSIILGKTPVYSILGSTDPSIWGTPVLSPSTYIEYDPIWDAVVIDYSAAGFRLPTEAEWEYAARGEQLTHNYIYSGSNTLDDVGWHKTNSGDQAQPVKSKFPNELGLYDMTGNVLESCNDWDGWPPGSCAINPTFLTLSGPSAPLRIRTARGQGFSTTILTYFTIPNRAGHNPGFYGEVDKGMRVVLPAL